MKDFLTKLRHATTDEDLGIKLKKVKMYNIIITYRFLSTGNTKVVSSNRYFTNEDQAVNFCRIMNEACKENEPDHKLTLSQEYDYKECELKIYDYFD